MCFFTCMSLKFNIARRDINEKYGYAIWSVKKTITV